MTRPMLINDWLALPGNHDVYQEAIDPNPSSGCIKGFDAKKREGMEMAPIRLKRLKELDIDHDMNVCGMPDQLVFDNGPEVNARRILSLEKTGVNVKYSRARTGHAKSIIERLNRSQKEALEGVEK